MYAKTGMGILAAAGVAFGVVGLTMGGASGSPATCTPSDSISGANGSDASRASNAAGNSSNGAGSGGAGVTDPNGTGGTPTDPAGGTTTDPGTTIGVGGTVPDIDSPPSTGSGSSSDRPLLHLSERTNPQNAAGLTGPPTGTSVIGRSSNVSGLHIFGHVNQGS